MNSVIITGRLTDEPETVTTQTGKTFVKFCVASNISKDRAEYVSFEAWENEANFISRYFHKGDGIVCMGQLRSQQYEKDGQKRKRWYVKLNHAEFGQSRKPDKEPVFDDDLPFG